MTMIPPSTEITTATNDSPVVQMQSGEATSGTKPEIYTEESFKLISEVGFDNTKPEEQHAAIRAHGAEGSEGNVEESSTSKILRSSVCCTCYNSN